MYVHHIWLPKSSAEYLFPATHYIQITSITLELLGKAKNSTLEVIILQLYLAARPCLCEVIPFNLKLANILHAKVGQDNVNIGVVTIFRLASLLQVY